MTGFDHIEIVFSFSGEENLRMVSWSRDSRVTIAYFPLSRIKIVNTALHRLVRVYLQYIVNVSSE